MSRHHEIHVPSWQNKLHIDPKRENLDEKSKTNLHSGLNLNMHDTKLVMYRHCWVEKHGT